MFEDVGISRITIQEFQRTTNVEPAGCITLALDRNFLLLLNNFVVTRGSYPTHGIFYFHIPISQTKNEPFWPETYPL